MDAIKAFIKPSRQPGTPAPLTPDESLKSAAVDNGIDFTKKENRLFNCYFQSTVSEL